MKITILTLFPEIFHEFINYSIIGRAIKKGSVDIKLINIRDFATDSHKTVDDRPYGGGTGMLLRVDVVERAIAKVKSQKSKVKNREKIVLLDPGGKQFTQAKARQYSKLDHLILVCGHYEGIDARIRHFVDESLSIGKYILSGGEVPSMVITEAVVRLISGVLKKGEAIQFESYTRKNLVEYPQYTRPPVYKGHQVPKILLSGNHQKIEEWKKLNWRVS